MKGSATSTLHPARRCALATVVAGALVLAACGDGSTASTATTAAGTTSAATTPGATSGPASTAPATTKAPSGSVTVYTGRSKTLVEPILAEFTTATGIKVELRTGDSGELGAQLITEGKASPADLFFSQDAGALGAVAKAGLLQPLPPDVLAAVPSAYRALDGTWVGVSGRVRVVVYNPALAPTPPKTVDEVLAPAWKGKVGFAPTNASWQSFVTGLRILRGDDGARKWLTAFAAQQPKAYSGNAAVRDAVDKGEISIGLVNHYYLFEKIAAEGAANVKAKNQFLAPGDPGGLVNVAGMGLLRTAKNPDAALALVRFLLSEKGQSYFATKTFEYPLAAGVKPAAEVPSLESLKPPAIDLTDLDSLARTQELLASTGLLTK
jgi:iron(III) transport system substrate-binding protein